MTAIHLSMMVILGMANEPLPDEFPVDPAIEGRVWFWEQIFGRFESHQAIFHDREAPEVIWLVVDLPEHRDKKRREEREHQLITETLADLRARLRRLEETPEARDDLDTRLLQVSAGNRARLNGAAGRLRTQSGVADRFRAGFLRSRAHIEVIYATLDKQGLPRKLAVLPFMESMFRPNVRSHAGAAGLWQLMPATARGLGLRVNAKLDERLNVVKATDAAARMLRDNYRMLQSWPLAITGYNHGPYGVKRATKALRTKKLWDLIQRYKKSTWGFASKNFYAEFIAVSRVYARAIEDAEELARSGL